MVDENSRQHGGRCGAAAAAGRRGLPIPGAQRPVVTLGPNAFDGRKLSPWRHSRDGNALVVFTTKDSMDCKPCAEMKALLKSADQAAARQRVVVEHAVCRKSLLR